jgi:hypothetical protein
MRRPCRVGIQLPEVERRVEWPELFSMARTGWNEREYRAFGFPYDHRVSRFEEARRYQARVSFRRSGPRPVASRSRREE